MINSILFNGSVGLYKQKIFLSGLKFKDTYIENAQLSKLKCLPKEISDKDLITEILDQGLIKNAKPSISYEDIEILSRFNNNVFGIVIAEILIKNSKACINRGAVSECKFEKVSLYGFKTVEPTLYSANLIVDWSNSFSNIPVNNNITEDSIINYIISTRGYDFIENLLPEVKAENIFILDKSSDPINGIIQFRIALNHYYDKTSGEYITPDNNKKYESEIFTIIGFKTKGITTILDCDNVHHLTNVSYLYASEFVLKEPLVKKEVLDFVKKNIKHMSFKNQPENIQLDDIKYNLVYDGVDNTKGQFKLYIYLLNKLGWENGEAQDTYSFKNIAYTFNGFKIQLPTSANKYSFKLDESWNKDINLFNKKDAELIVNKNLDTIFSDCPPDQNVKVTSLRFIPLSGNVLITFKLNYYYDSRGILSTSKKRSITHTIILTGFDTKDTSIISKWIELPNLDNIYSIDDAVKDTYWLKSKITRDLFINLPLDYDLDSNLIVSNIRNTWIDKNIIFGSIKFDLSLPNISNNGEFNDALLINDIVMSGFNTNDCTTTQITKLIYCKELSYMLPSCVIECFALNKLKIKYVIEQAHRLKPIFKNLVPMKELTKENINIDGVTDTNDRIGSLTVFGSINNVSWVNGIICRVPFDITIIGLKTQAPTIFNKTTNINVCFKLIEAHKWNNKIAQSYVIENIHQFVANLPKIQEPSDLSVRVLGYSNEHGIVTISIILNSYFDENGLKVNWPIKTKQFNLVGFKKYVPHITKQIHTSIFSMFVQLKIISDISSFTDDFFSAQKPIYEAEMLKFISKGNNVYYMLDNCENNDFVVVAKKLKFIRNPDNPVSSVIVMVEFDNCSIGYGLLGKRVFYYTLHNLLPIPNIDLSTSPNLTINALNAMIQNNSDIDEFKTQLISSIYNALIELIYANEGKNFPRVIKEAFDEENKAMILHAISSGIKLNHTCEDDSENSKIVKSFYFTPIHLSELPQLTYTSFGTRIRPLSFYYPKFTPLELSILDEE